METKEDVIPLAAEEVMALARKVACRMNQRERFMFWAFVAVTATDAMAAAQREARCESSSPA